MTVAALLARGRARHQRLMLDTVVVVRPGVQAWNSATQVNTTPTTAVYTGICRLVLWRGNEEQSADAEVSVVRYRLDLPLSASPPILARRDLVSVTASSNAALAGLSLVVTEQEFGTTATALRWIAEAVT